MERDITGLTPDEALASKIEERYQEALEPVKQLHDQWWTAHSFWDGKQYIFYSQGRPRTKKAPSWRIRSTHNLVKPAARVLISKATQQRPGWECEVESMEYDAFQMARASEDFLEHLYFERKFSAQFREAVFWALVAGNGFLKRRWDEHAVMTSRPEEEPEFMGLPELWAPTPFDVLPDPRATSMDDAEWVIVTHTMSPDELDSMFGEGTAERLQEAAASTEEESHWYRQEVRGHYSQTGKQDLFRVCEYEEKPSASNEWRGIRALSVGTELLSNEPLPHGRFSVYHFRYGEGGGRFWGTGFPVDTLDIQQEYNRTVSQIIELRNLHCLPVWVMPMGSVSKTAVVNRPDARVEYNPQLGPAPFRVDPVPIPPSLENFLQTLKQEFQDVVGVHDVSFGKQESGVTSGKAIGQLKDSNDLQMGSFFEQAEEVWSEVGKDLLLDWKLYGSDEYVYSALGEGRAPEIKRLHKDHLLTGVRVRPGSMAYVNPSWATQNAKEMYQIGAFGDPSDPEALMRFRRAVNSVQGMESFWGDETIHRVKARKENDLIYRGIPVEADWPEDHLAHYDEHLRMYFSSEGMRPENQQYRIALNKHMAEHLRQHHATTQGLPTYMQAFGLTLEELQGNIQGQMQAPQQQQAPQEQPPQEQGMVGGGDPFMNGAHLTPEQEQVDPEAQYK